jgi:hypothetical protein
MWGGVMQLMQRQWFVNMEPSTLGKLPRKSFGNGNNGADYLPKVESVKSLFGLGAHGGDQRSVIQRGDQLRE